MDGLGTNNRFKDKGRVVHWYIATSHRKDGCCVWIRKYYIYIYHFKETIATILHRVVNGFSETSIAGVFDKEDAMALINDTVYPVRMKIGNEIENRVRIRTNGWR